MKTKRLSVLAIAFIALVHVSTFAGEAPTRVELVAERDLQPMSDWYGMYGPDGKKIGFANMTLEKHGGGNNAFYRFAMNCRMQVAAFGQVVNMKMETRVDYDAAPPYAIRGGSSRESDGNSEKTIELVKVKEGFEATIKEAGEKRVMKFPSIDATLADELAQEVWLRQQKRSIGDKLVTRTFEIDELKADVETNVIKAMHDTVADGIKVTYYEIMMSSESDGDVGVARATQKGKLISAKFGGLFELRLEPESLAKKIEVSADLFLATMAQVNAPLGDPSKMTKLVLEVTGNGADKLTPSADQTITKEAAAYVLTLGAGQGTPVAATEAEIADSLKETVKLPVKNEKVVALAKEAIGNAKTDAEKVAKLVAFVSEYIEDSFSAEPLTVLDILRVKKGDCTEHAALFATLARAAGIPAREISGLIYMGDEYKAFGGHAWNEVVLDGKWVGVDATWNETKLNPTHIRLNTADRDAGTFMSVLGQIKFKLREVVPPPLATGKKQR